MQIISNHVLRKFSSRVKEETIGDNEGPCLDLEVIKGERISGFPPNSCVVQWNPKLEVYCFIKA